MAKKSRFTNKEGSKDSEVVGAILAGIATTKKDMSDGLAATETTTAMCAVGAGNRGRKVTRAIDVLRAGDPHYKTNSQLVPMIRFAMANGVTENYACGVNDGFELDDDHRTAAELFYPSLDKTSRDYERGLHVGVTIREDLDAVEG